MLSLREINLARNQIEGSVPDAWGRLERLRRLDLSRNLMSGLSESMVKLKKMEYLDVSHNQITGCVPDWLRVLIQPVTAWGSKARLKLQTVHISENRWDVEVPLGP